MEEGFDDTEPGYIECAVVWVWEILVKCVKRLWVSGNGIIEIVLKDAKKDYIDGQNFGKVFIFAFYYLISATIVLLIPAAANTDQNLTSERKGEP